MTWAYTAGVAHFFQPDYYWGEISQAEARSFIQAAKQLGWREAVASRFADDSNMTLSILDWQRASWIPLLGLNDDAVALDIGSGYGAITHALAQSFGTVVSLEAMRERIDFTRVRLEQEGLGNVQLVQGSALDLPFFNESFDLIVVNGVLEWIGEWDQSQPVRSAQLQFLARLQRLLKADGILVIGIENRFNYEALRGAIDHSGLSYTSLMPRPIASFYVRHCRRQHYRSALKRTEYRTYTYSERGYRKLLADAGFASQGYWPYPGYNNPMSVVPLSSRFTREEVIFSKPRDLSKGKQRYSRRVLKNLLTRSGVLRLMVPDFLIFASKLSVPAEMFDKRLWESIQRCVPNKGAAGTPQFTLSTEPFAKKALLRIFDSNGDGAKLIVKTSTAARGSSHLLQREFANLSLVSSRLRDSLSARIAVPQPFGMFRIGRYHYAVESVASGQPLSTILFNQSPTRRVDYLADHLPRCVESAVELMQLLKGTDTVSEVDPHWWRLPAAETADTAKITNPIVSPYRDSYTEWVQHGDFTIENLFVDSQGNITAVDWEHLVRGVPPLYDIFTCLLSLTDAVFPHSSGDARFLQAFFSDNPFATLCHRVLLAACKALMINPDAVWPMFLESLLLRINDHTSRGSNMVAHDELRYLELAIQHPNEFQL